jgi:hypothetical protein
MRMILQKDLKASPNRSEVLNDYVRPLHLIGVRPSNLPESLGIVPSFSSKDFAAMCLGNSTENPSRFRMVTEEVIIPLLQISDRCLPPTTTMDRHSLKVASHPSANLSSSGRLPHRFRNVSKFQA